MAFKLEAIELREVLNRNVEPLTEYVYEFLNFFLRLYFSKLKSVRSREYKVDVFKKLRPVVCIKQTKRALSRFVKAWVLLIQNKCEWMNKFLFLSKFQYFA